MRVIRGANSSLPEGSEKRGGLNSARPNEARRPKPRPQSETTENKQPVSNKNEESE